MHFWMHFASVNCTIMKDQNRFHLGIYVRYNSSSVIKFLKPMTSDIFFARFADYHFDEIICSLSKVPNDWDLEKKK